MSQNKHLTEQQLLGKGWKNLGKRDAFLTTDEQKEDLSGTIADFRAKEFLLRQEEAKQWIEDMLEIQIDTSQSDFIDQLRNGALLCRLANCFNAEKIKVQQVAKGSPMELGVATDNVSNFFESCAKIRFPKIYWFTLPDLWERKNIAVVIHCIHALAHFLDRKGHLKDKSKRIKDLTNEKIEFDSKEIEKVKTELKKMEDLGINLDFGFKQMKGIEKKHVEPPKHIEDDLFLSEDSLELADASQCTYEGRGAKICVCGKEATFNIQSRNQNGNPITVGGETFECILTKDGVRYPVTVKDLGTGKYKVTYTVTKTGKYKMDILLDKKYRIRNCPFEITAVDAGVTKTYQIIKAPKEYYEGKPYEILLQAYDEFGNARTNGGDNLEPRLQFRKQDGTFISVPGCTVQDLNDGRYALQFTCPISGNYELHLEKDGKLYAGFKPLSVQAMRVAIPTLDIKYEPFKAGQYVIQFKAHENVLGKEKDRWVSIVMRDPGSGALPFELKENIKLVFTENWKNWIREYAIALKNDMVLDRNTWGDYTKRSKHIQQEMSNHIPFPNKNKIEYVTISDQYLDWSELEKKKSQKSLPPTPPPKRQGSEKIFDPNDQGLMPRRCAMDFWTYVSQLIAKAKQKQGVQLNDQGNIVVYEIPEIYVKEYLSENVFNTERKQDILDYGKHLIRTGQRFVFEILHELESSIQNFENIKAKAYTLAKGVFQHFKELDEQLTQKLLVGKPLNVELDSNMKTNAKSLIKSLKRRILQIIRVLNLDLQRILEVDFGLSMDKVSDISLFSTFFKVNISELYLGFKLVKGYELSSKPRKIIVSEMIMKNQFGKLSKSYAISVPLHNQFDSQLFKKNTNSSTKDRTRPGLINPWKTAYVKFNRVIFESIRSGSLPAIGLDSAEKRNAIALENAVTLLKAIAANHCKRFSRVELWELILQKRPLNVPLTCVSVMTPFFLGKREDRQCLEHERAIFQAIEKNLVTSVVVDLFDGRQPLEVQIQFIDPVFVNFGTNLVIKTFLMGFGIQRAINGRKYGMRRFEQKVNRFLKKLGQRKAELRKQMIEYINTQFVGTREGAFYKKSFGDLLGNAEKAYEQMLALEQQSFKEIEIMDYELSLKQKELERRIEEYWIPKLDNITSVEYVYQTSIKKLAGEIVRDQKKIYKIEATHREKLTLVVEFERRFLEGFQQLLNANPNLPVPNCYNEFFELALLEKDMHDLYIDLLELFHNKQHEKFAQGLTEHSEPWRVDPYAVPVRVLLLSFHMGEQIHYNCKSGKDRTAIIDEQCQEFAELHAMYGEYPRFREEKEKYNNHRRQIQTTLALNGNTHDIIKLNIGVPGSKVDASMSYRFTQGQFKKYKALSDFDMLTYSSKDDWNTIKRI